MFRSLRTRVSKSIDERKAKQLFDAIKDGNANKVNTLLDEGVDPTHTYLITDVPLGFAIEKNKFEIVRILLEHGADPNVGSKIPGMTTPLYVATYSDNLELARMLLAFGADPNLQSDIGIGISRRPLITAVSKGNIQMVRLLLDGGGDPNLSEEDFSTPLSNAVEAGNIQIVRVLIENGAHAVRSMRLLNKAAYQGHTAILKLLLDLGLGDVNDADSLGLTPLHQAAERGRTQTCKLLLERGANTNAADNTGATALHQASEYGHVEVVQLLLAHGADPNMSDRYGRRAIDYAQMRGRSRYNASIVINPNVAAFQRIVELLSGPALPPPEPIPVLGRVVLRNAYKDLGVEPDAKPEDIRKAYMALRRALEKQERAATRGIRSSPSLASITASYNILKNHREEYDAVVTIPKRDLLKKIREVCFDDADPISMKSFEDMSLEELRRVYVISAKEDKRIEQARVKGHCFEKSTLKEMIKNGIQRNPMTREPLRPQLLEELAKRSAGGKRSGRGGRKEK